MKPLSDAVQSLLSATTRINTYKSAIEELVYNAIDSKASSIAIRLDIPESTIQVVDNGHGVTKIDMNHIGKKHMTSKNVDLLSHKSVPTYGFRGQSLASLIEVSKIVKITSRVDSTDETWVKTFYKGRERCISACTTRPSKGTTVDIQGFLHNLPIQKKSVNPLAELQDIKNFLQHLSLVHNNISISLRDNSNNDIVFQIHKCRDIYQTFSTLLMIEKDCIQELQVEKRLYKIVAYIGKLCWSENNDYHWIYLNGRFISISRLHKILDSNFTKLLGLRNQNKDYTKTRNNFADDEKGIFKKKIPFYFVFITCPYNDYDLNETSKTLELEFKDWNNIIKLLEKLVKFYTGDVNLKEVQEVNTKALKSDITGDTRDEVKKILEKILASNTKRLGVSQLQNGIKGKLVKRKKNKTKELALLKKLPQSNDDARKMNSSKQIRPANIQIDESGKHCNESNDKNDAEYNPFEESTEKRKLELKEAIKLQKITKQDQLKPKKSVNEIKNKQVITPNRNNRQRVDILPRKHNKVNLLVKSFQDKPTVVKQRCKLLSKKVEKLKQNKNVHKRKIIVTESSQYSNIQSKNQNITVKKTVGEIIIHDTLPMPPDFNPRRLHYNIRNDIMQKQYHKSYDLLQTILKTQDKNHNQDNICRPSSPSIAGESCAINGFDHKKRNAQVSNYPDSIISTLNTNFSEPKLTYESHTYYQRHMLENKRRYSNGDSPKQRHQRFITKQSKEIFATPKTTLGQRLRFKPYRRSYANYNRKLTMLTNLNHHKENSYTIEFSQSNETNCAMNYEIVDETNNLLDENKYTINKEDQRLNTLTNIILNCTYTIGRREEESRNIPNTSMNTVVSQQYEQNFMNMDTFENSLLNSHRSINTIEDSIVKSYRTYCVKNNASVKNADKQTSPMIPLKSKMNQPKEKEQSGGLNVIFVSKSGEQAKLITSSDEDINPLYLCETLLNNNELTGEKCDLNLDQNNFEALSNAAANLNHDGLSIPSDAMATYNAVEEVSHHFNDINQSIIPNQSATHNPSPKVTYKEMAKEMHKFKKDGNIFHLNKDTGMTLSKSPTKEMESFEFRVRNRPRYIPKGMSPIFENCNTKNACNYDLEEDYFGNSMYDDFAKAVDANVDLFEANVEEMTNLATREINRFNERLKKDTASLCFQGEQLREAKILGQVDSKFIAAKILGSSAQTQLKEYLVLFDQHAVHERIRLENNLSEYLTDNQWKSVALDDVTIKLKPDDTVYLHNYRDKFKRLGLRWTIDGGIVSVTAIPEAIIGKNARQVQVIMKAVKSLILEEIEAIKSQKGSLSLYPKSIMDLVFSEACRYAIKFGDRLAYNDCVGLLRELSECKTPFQCAHGRPVMAVLMEIKPKYSVYQIDLNKLEKFGNVLKIS